MSSNTVQQMNTFDTNEQMKLAEGPLAAGTISKFLETVHCLGLCDLPWMVPLEHVDNTCLSDELSQWAVSAERGLTAWASNPLHDNSDAAISIGLIATYALLAEGCIKLLGTSVQSIVRMYGWLVIVEKALCAIVKFKMEPAVPSLPPGPDNMVNLYTLFHNSKKQGNASKVVTNFVLAALALRYTIKGKEVPDTWKKVQSLKSDELLEYSPTSWSTAEPTAWLQTLLKGSDPAPPLCNNLGLRPTDLTSTPQSGDSSGSDINMEPINGGVGGDDEMGGGDSGDDKTRGGNGGDIDMEPANEGIGGGDDGEVEMEPTDGGAREDDKTGGGNGGDSNETGSGSGREGQGISGGDGREGQGNGGGNGDGSDSNKTSSGSGSDGNKTLRK
ncbi:hypothetical protein BDN71DRAFT_1513697 [Pleurotus eryngii]|uniref:Uncharacterized protein n=1 Tax=Pleurotus eryngii TaxID=5323 RepID=A0A9P5ZGN9_PLEER|nr:hypothetical protein BDN71DRAFT_1513697 [Pleurotus eryngii]